MPSPPFNASNIWAKISRKLHPHITIIYVAVTNGGSCGSFLFLAWVVQLFFCDTSVLLWLSFHAGLHVEMSMNLKDGTSQIRFLLINFLSWWFPTQYTTFLQFQPKKLLHRRDYWTCVEQHGPMSRCFKQLHGNMATNLFFSMVHINWILCRFNSCSSYRFLKWIDTKLNRYY